MDKKFANQKQLIALCAAGFFSATSFQGCSGKTDNANVIDPTILNHISETLEGNNDATAPSPENKKLTPKDLGFDCNKLNSSGKTTVIVNNGCIDEGSFPQDVIFCSNMDEALQLLNTNEKMIIYLSPGITPSPTINVPTGKSLGILTFENLAGYPYTALDFSNTSDFIEIDGSRLDSDKMIQPNDTYYSCISLDPNSTLSVAGGTSETPLIIIPACLNQKSAIFAYAQENSDFSLFNTYYYSQDEPTASDIILDDALFSTLDSKLAESTIYSQGEQDIKAKTFDCSQFLVERPVDSQNDYKTILDDCYMDVFSCLNDKNSTVSNSICSILVAENSDIFVNTTLLSTLALADSSLDMKTSTILQNDIYVDSSSALNCCNCLCGTLNSEGLSTGTLNIYDSVEQSNNAKPFESIPLVPGEDSYWVVPNFMLKKANLKLYNTDTLFATKDDYIDRI